MNTSATGFGIAKRLYALLGDKMHDFPPHFIEHLERRLEEFETSLTSADVVVGGRGQGHGVHINRG